VRRLPRFAAALALVGGRLATPGIAGLLERRAGGSQQPLGRLLVDQPRDPDRNRDPACPADLELLEPQQDAVDRLAGGCRAGLGKQQGELVTAHTACEVVDSSLLRDQVSDGAQHPVARCIAVAQVDGAKSVDVDQRDAERPPVALRTQHVELELGAKGAQGQKRARERVERVALGQLALQLSDALARLG